MLFLLTIRISVATNVLLKLHSLLLPLAAQQVLSRMEQATNLSNLLAMILIL